MGGYGSGWQTTKKATVGESFALSIFELVRIRALVPGARSSGALNSTANGLIQTHKTIRYQADLSDREAAWMRLEYSVNGEPIDCRIKLVTTTPHYGGVRWWFICPLVHQDGGQPRRVAKLYLPRSGRHFGSREGYGLTYASCQESGRFRRIIRLMAAGMRTDETTVRQTVNALIRQNARERRRLQRAWA